MTGSATATSAPGPHPTVGAEARSVNHRYLKSTVRVEGRLPRLEPWIEDAVRERFARGHVVVVVRATAPAGEGEAALVDAEAFARAARELKRLAAAHGLPAPRTVDVLGLIARERSVEPEEEEAARAVREAVVEALDGLEAARRREGALLVEHVERLLAEVEAATKELASRATGLPASWAERLRRRAEELAAQAGTTLDPGLLEREALQLAERGDVEEERARLQAHVAHARELLAAGGAVGKRLDFLAQEMQREANTIGAKAHDLATRHLAVALKTWVERLREQAQNLE